MAKTPRICQLSVSVLNQSQIDFCFLKWSHVFGRIFHFEGKLMCNKIHLCVHNAVSVSYAPATHYRRLSGLRQRKCIVLQFWDQVSEMGINGRKPRCRQCYVPSGSSRGEVILLPVPPSRSCRRPWLVAPFLIFKASGIASFRFPWTLLLSSHLLL